jgi:hypothetical protein
MYSHKVFFRSKGLEYCGGQNRANSPQYLLWVNERNGKEFAQHIGEVNLKTNTFKPDEGYENLPKQDVQRLVELATFK